MRLRPLLLLYDHDVIRLLLLCRQYINGAYYPGEPEKIEPEMELFFHELMGKGRLEVVVGKVKPGNAC